MHPRIKVPLFGILEEENVRICKGETLWNLSKTDETIPLSIISKYLPPVSPPNILALGVNYYSHANEGKWSVPERPVLFLKATTSVVGHKDNIVLPKMAPNDVDYEGELAIIIGRDAKNVAENEISKYILGWTCGNDVSARDCQFGKDGQWARAKSFDTFCPLGPWMETDLDLSQTRIQTRVNKRLLQDSTIENMIFPVETLVSYLSHCMTLLPGTVIMTGTPEGIGFTRKPPIFLRPRDMVEITIEGIGTLENSVSAEQ
jgi:2-keto-4-pentenoate hydratase/2-oxohepta-3-ene-1,7-dioic acid hydratase in catechol pathway